MNLRDPYCNDFLFADKDEITLKIFNCEDTVKAPKTKSKKKETARIIGKGEGQKMEINKLVFWQSILN
ncbi:MAG: hypothetical protein C0433_07155 [Cyclobacterium sp.]|nr:hypothetical protein [Cyclobacterium sp.]